MSEHEITTKLQDRLEELRKLKHEITSIPIDFWGDQVYERLNRVETRMDEVQTIARILGVETF